MKYIVDIHESIYNHFKNNEYSRQDVVAIHNSIMDAKPLDNVLDKIRAEIKEEKEYAYADFEQYKVDYLGQDEEDVLDSLPQDDFRYGMERAIEIIDKYRKEQE